MVWIVVDRTGNTVSIRPLRTREEARDFIKRMKKKGVWFAEQRR